MKSNLKVVVSGMMVEVYQSETAIFRKKEEASTKQQISGLITKSSCNGKGNCGTSAINRTKSNMRARNIIRRLIASNFSFGNVKFITLTFKQNNINIVQANREFSKFMERLKYYIRQVLGKDIELKYICVAEFQIRGCIHYHMIIKNLPFIPITRTMATNLKNSGGLPKSYKERWNLKDIWKHGDVSIQKCTSVQTLSNYMVKELKPQVTSNLPISHKSYFTSRNNLVRPKELIGNEAVVFLMKKQANAQQVYESEYKTKTGETVVYKEYKLSNKKKSIW